MAKATKKKLRKVTDGGYAYSEANEPPLQDRLLLTNDPRIIGAGGDNGSGGTYVTPIAPGLIRVSPNNRTIRLVSRKQFARDIAAAQNGKRPAKTLIPALSSGPLDHAVAGTSSTKDDGCACDTSHIVLGATTLNVTPLGAAAIIAAIAALIILKVL